MSTRRDLAFRLLSELGKRRDADAWPLQQFCFGWEPPDEPARSSAARARTSAESSACAPSLLELRAR
jgi:hypothetical protein